MYKRMKGNSSKKEIKKKRSLNRPIAYLQNVHKHGTLWRTTNKVIYELPWTLGHCTKQPIGYKAGNMYEHIWKKKREWIKLQRTCVSWMFNEADRQANVEKSENNYCTLKIASECEMMATDLVLPVPWMPVRSTTDWVPRKSLIWEKYSSPPTNILARRCMFISCWAASASPSLTKADRWLHGPRKP